MENLCVVTFIGLLVQHDPVHYEAPLERDASVILTPIPRTYHGGCIITVLSAMILCLSKEHENGLEYE